MGPLRVVSDDDRYCLLAGALSAVLMAIAIRCHSVKEAQANAAGVVLVVSLGLCLEFQPLSLWLPSFMK